MYDHNFECIDVGSENCPCYLALTGDCLVCSRLQGREECDCNWKGVCVYNEFIQGNRKINNPRKDFPAEIVYKKSYLDDLFVVGLKVGKGFALKAASPGSFVFLKEKGSGCYYDTPLCIMDADVENGIIAVAIKVISAKTKLLAEAQDELIVRGVYRNGILGIGSITPRLVRNNKILIAAKGIGLAPAILTANYLQNKNRIDMIIDKEKISGDLMNDYLKDCNGTIKFMSLAEENCRRELEEILNVHGYNMVVLLASDYYLNIIGEKIKKILPNARLAVSNNFHICCGEGVCGACTIAGAGGETIRMCKCNKKTFDNSPRPW